MTLDNLLGVSLERVEADPLMIKRLLEAAQRNMKDAELTDLSTKIASTSPTRPSCSCPMRRCKAATIAL